MQEKIDDEDLNDNFVGLFLADRMNKFINFKQMIHKKHPFLIANTEDSSKE